MSQNNYIFKQYSASKGSKKSTFCFIKQLVSSLESQPVVISGNYIQSGFQINHLYAYMYMFIKDCPGHTGQRDFASL